MEVYPLTTKCQATSLSCRELPPPTRSVALDVYIMVINKLRVCDVWNVVIGVRVSPALVVQ